jgi:hypothetical protein
MVEKHLLVHDKNVRKLLLLPFHHAYRWLLASKKVENDPFLRPAVDRLQERRPLATGHAQAIHEVLRD